MIQIRALRQNDDFHDLIALSREFFREYEVHHDNFFAIGQLHDGDIIGYFSRWTNDENGETFIALDEGRIVGYITMYVQPQAAYWKVKKVGHISGLMVHADYRRKGIAGRLIDHARTFFAGRGVKYFTAYTAVENNAALSFYERHGLVPLHTTVIGVSSATPDA
jgi:ribosomal protein S18 acetylase RimI-like enzyme